jgi:exonuclease III
VKVATFNINNINKRLDNLLAWLTNTRHQEKLEPQSLLVITGFEESV